MVETTSVMKEGFEWEEGFCIKKDTLLMEQVITLASKYGVVSSTTLDSYCEGKSFLSLTNSGVLMRSVGFRGAIYSPQDIFETVAPVEEAPTIIKKVILKQNTLYTGLTYGEEYDVIAITPSSYVLLVGGKEVFIGKDNFITSTIRINTKLTTEERKIVGYEYTNPWESGVCKTEYWSVLFEGLFGLQDATLESMLEGVGHYREYHNSYSACCGGGGVFTYEFTGKGNEDTLLNFSDVFKPIYK